MRIVGGAWRGRRLITPAGEVTRPTSDRARQALFDMLMHAPWAGRDALDGAHVLDAFAGTGALGLEALSRGAAHATFMEQDPAALQALRANILCCSAQSRSTVVAGSALAPPPLAGLGRGADQGRGEGKCNIVFLDPPYGQNLIPPALAALSGPGWIVPGTLIVAETSSSEPAPTAAQLLAERNYGAARITTWRME